MKLESLRDLSKDDVLGALGLAMRPSGTDKLLHGLALFGAGLAVGAGFALAFAPKSGRELRSDVGSSLRSVRDRASETVDQVRDKVARRDDARELT